MKELHKKIGKMGFVSLIPISTDARGKFGVQASYGTKERYVRGRTYPLTYEHAKRVYDFVSSKTTLMEFLRTNKINGD